MGFEKNGNYCCDERSGPNKKAPVYLQRIVPRTFQKIKCSATDCERFSCAYHPNYYGWYSPLPKTVNPPKEESLTFLGDKV